LKGLYGLYRVWYPASEDDRRPYVLGGKMAHKEASREVTAEGIALLARLADLPLEPRRLPLLATALATDLRLIDTLRGVDVGETFPAPLGQSNEGRDGH